MNIPAKHGPFDPEWVAAITKGLSETFPDYDFSNQFRSQAEWLTAYGKTDRQHGKVPIMKVTPDAFTMQFKHTLGNFTGGPRIEKITGTHTSEMTTFTVKWVLPFRDAAYTVTIFPDGSRQFRMNGQSPTKFQCMDWYPAVYNLEHGFQYWTGDNVVLKPTVSYGNQSFDKYYDNGLKTGLIPLRAGEELVWV